MLTKHKQIHKLKKCKIAQTQWKYFFNDTFLMKGLALLFKVFVICTMFMV